MARTDINSAGDSTSYAWPSISLRLPDWVGEETGPPGGRFHSNAGADGRS